ncbi:MAG: glycogen/starch synthase [Patescibacteria group bacterium]
MNRTINVLFASSEATPLAKVGGLADVVGALPKALAKHAIEARIIMPLYKIIDTKKFPITKLGAGLTVEFNSEKVNVDLYTAKLPNSEVMVYLIESPKYFHQGAIYFEKSVYHEGLTEVSRFSFFAKAVIDLLPQLKWPVNIIHCHDWHTGLIPALKKIAADNNPSFKTIKTIYTIHNLANQGKWNAAEVIRSLGYTEQVYPDFSLTDNQGNINMAEQGINSSAMVTTVSPTYAREITTPEYGFGLENILSQKSRENKLVGIINGIDTDHFNPEKDPAIPHSYTANDLAGKIINKADLQKELGLKIDVAVPIFSFIGRLMDQKGFDLIPLITDQLFDHDAQLIVLGTGTEKYEAAVRKLAENHPASVKAIIKFDAGLAQRIYAGSDFFLMPSRFEPCGLGQMIAMRYGTLPIVNATGGLRDTITEIAGDEGNGLVMNNPEPKELISAIERGLDLFSDKASWSGIVKRLMLQDFSWNRSSLEYLKLYQSLVK